MPLVDLNLMLTSVHRLEGNMNNFGPGRGVSSNFVTLITPFSRGCAFSEMMRIWFDFNHYRCTFMILCALQYLIKGIFKIRPPLCCVHTEAACCSIAPPGGHSLLCCYISISLSISLQFKRPVLFLFLSCDLVADSPSPPSFSSQSKSL